MITYDFDRADIESIKRQAEQILHKSLSEVLSDAQLDDIKKKIDVKRKGHLGNVIEKYIFNKDQDSESAPDFYEASLELKTTPLKETKRKGLVAKERLVFGMIDYFGIVKEDWASSAFLKKNANLLILFYIYRNSETILDYKFELIKLLQLLSLPPADIQQMRKDWETICSKVKAGKAHELSEGDTFYIGACTKGSTAEKSLKSQPFSDIKAKGRAFSLKQAYLNFMIAADRAKMSKKKYSTVLPGPKHEGIGAFIHAHLNRYLGKTVEEIHEATGAYLAPGAKAYYSDLACAMLDAKKRKIAEFEKADVKMKIVRLKHTGTPKESMSFPAMDYEDIVEENWEESTLREMLANRKYLFIIYRYDKSGTLRFDKYVLWNIPESDLETHVRKVWEETVDLIRHCQADALPGIKWDPVCHVRPHGKDSHDIAPTPCGTYVKKQSFWLNASYIRDQIKKAKN